MMLWVLKENCQKILERDCADVDAMVGYTVE